nr:retrovirus-related Pol polyprotein from transposon TNT 1-94 [Tanacetum cinerariifolium]
MIPEPGDTNREVPADDQAIQTILFGLPEDIHAAVDSYETAQEIWLRVQKMMKGSDIGIQEKKDKLFNEWERFTSNKEESIESYYHRFLKLMNDLKRNKHFPKKISSNLKFLNNLQPEWSRHVTIVHQTKDLHTVDYTQLYDFLKYNQKEVDELKAERLAKIQDPLALMANSNNPYAFPAPHQDQPSFNQNYMQQPMPNSDDVTDPITVMNMALTLMAKAFKLNYSTPTNNNQRISSNTRNRQIAQPGNLNGYNAVENVRNQVAQNPRVQNVGNENRLIGVPGNANQNGNGNLVTQLLIAQKEEAGIQLQAEEFDLMAAAADIDEIEEVNANCILMANLQQASTSGTQTDKAPVYDSDGSAEEATKFVGDFKSLAKETDDYLAKHKALELEIERLLRAVVSQDIMSVVQKESVVDTSNLQTKLERTKERFENCIIKKENEYAKLWNDCENVELEFQVLNYAKENTHLKATYKNLFDFISVLRTQTKTIIASMQHELQNMIYKNAKLRAQLFKKVSVQKDNKHGTSTNTKFAKQSILGKPPKVGEIHALSKPVTLNSTATPQESKVMQNDKVIAPGLFRINPFKTSREEKHVPNTVITCARTKPITVSQPSVITKKDVNSNSNVNHDVCLRNYVKGKTSRGKKQKANVSIKEKQKKHQPKAKQTKKVGFIERLATPKPSKTRFLLRWSPTGRLFDQKGKIVDSSESESQSDCSNGDNACTSNTLEPKIKRFPNSTSLLGRLSRFVYGQFCDSDLKVAFRRNACFVRNLDGVDLLKGDRSTNLYTINLHEMASASPIYLMARTSSTKSWLWHQRLSHLNFDTINDLAKNDLVSGLPKFKYHKEHLCPSCEQGKSKRAPHPPKPVPNSRQRLHLLHMDLYGPMRIASINGKRYVLVIGDDYFLYTWVHFLRSKDEAPEVIKTFLKRITVLLHVGISHQMSSIRTPQQNRVVEHKNRTLVKAARTMLIFSRAPLFLWAEAIATACFTQNSFIIHRHFNKTPYELINGRKLDISFLHVFGALCYPKNDRKDIGKLGAKGDIGFFIGYSADSCAYRIFNRRTKKIMKTMNVSFDELSVMAFEQHSLKPSFKDVDELTSQQQHVQQQGSQAHLQFKTAADNVSNVMFDANTFVNPFANPSTSAAESSSSQNMDPSNMHTNQLRSDGDMSLYALTVSTMEPKNVKEAMTDPAWTESMQ